MLEQQKKSFLTGHWNTYDIEELEPENELTPCQIFKNLNSFSKSYTIKKEIFAIEDLICIILCLEELPNTISSKKDKKNKSSRERSLKKTLKSYKFKFAINTFDSLLFCSRIIPELFKEEFSSILNAKSMKLKELSGSPPLQLLLLHRQASEASTVFKALMDIHSLDCIEENEVPNKNEVFFKIGSSQLQIPQIKKLSCSIDNMSFSTTEHSFKDITMKKVKVELSGHSLFDLYLDLAEQKVISSVPDWITACRHAGKTHMNISYID